MPALERSLDNNPAPRFRSSYSPLKREHSDAVLNASAAEKNQALIQNYTGYLPPFLNLKKRDIGPTQAWMERKPSRDTAPSGADMRPNPAIDLKPAKGARHSYFALSSGSGPAAEASAPPPPPAFPPYRRRRPEEELAM